MIRALALLAALPATADSVLATRPLRAGAVLGPNDVAASPRDVPGGVVAPDMAIGLETRRNIYAGMPIMAADLGPPAVVARNDIVELAYRRGGLSIVTEGRALDRAGPGETVRVMNLSSRVIVTGRVTDAGLVDVTP